MSKRQLPALVLGLTIAVFVGTAVVVGLSGNDRLARAEEHLRALYESGDVARTLDRLAPGSFGADADTRAQLEPALSQLLAEELQVTESRLVEVRGIELAEIQTPRITWCVTPENRLILGCRVASAEVDAEVRGAPVEVAFANLDVFAGQVDLVIVLTTNEQEPVDLGEVSIDAEGFEFVEASYVAGGQQAPVAPGEVQVQPGLGLLLYFRAQEPADVDALVGEPMNVSFDGGEVVLEVPELEWAVGAPTDGGGS